MSRPKPIPLAPGGWVKWAACTNVDMSLNRGGDSGHARRLIERYCHNCAVELECREWAMHPSDPAAYHVAGGMTPSERKEARKTG